jgi:hypothetical protein
MRGGLVLLFVLMMFSGCATKQELKEVENSMDERMALLKESLENRLNNLEESLQKKLGELEDKAARRAELTQKTDSLSAEIERLKDQKADLGLVQDLDRRKFDRTEVEDLNLDEIRKRLSSAEYNLRQLREQFLTPASTGYRNAVRAAQETAMELLPSISDIVGGRKTECSIFVRDFRRLNDTVPVLGDLLAREFASSMRARTGMEKNIYREEQVIRQYKKEGLELPEAEMPNLNVLERLGFNTDAVIVIIGKLTPMADVIRLDVEAIDLANAQFQASSTRLIPTDADVERMCKEPARPSDKQSDKASGQ